MLKNFHRLFSRYVIASLCAFFPFSCLPQDSYSELIGKDVTMPCRYDYKTEFTLIHIVRNQECTKCSVSALYQWNDVISQVGRKDISFFYIIETRPEDTPKTIKEALQRRPFSEPMYVDYNHAFLEDNKWLKKRKYREINDMVLNSSGKIVMIGDPLNNFQFLTQMKNI